MEDINNMDMVEFNRLNDFLKKRSNIRAGQPVTLQDSNREMIRRAKEKK